MVTRWLAGPGVRVVSCPSGYASPIGSAARWADWAATARSARLAAAQPDTHTDDLDDRYGVHKPRRAHARAV